MQTKDSWLHMVYESMGHVWYEAKSPSGSWQLMNNGQPLDNGAGKCPSIDWHYNTNDPNNTNYNAVVIAYQQQYGTRYTIEYYVFKYTSGSYVRQGKNFGGPLYSEPSGGDLYSSVNANPNIAWGKYYKFALSFERKSTVGSMQPGIYWIYGAMYESGVEPVPALPCSPVKITGTSTSSTNAAISLNKQSVDVAVFDIVYQEGTSNIKDIWITCTYNSGWFIAQGNPFTISSMSGYKNYQPSIVQMHDENIRVCWIRDLYGGGSATPTYVNVVYWKSASPSVYNYTGNMVNSVSLNVLNGNTNTYYAYAQNTNNSNWQNFARSGSSTISLSTTGRNIQLCNGTSSSNMYASSYYPVSLPYYFQTSNSLGGLAKSSAKDDIYGRGIVLRTDKIGFSYSIKSLSVDNSYIKFTEIPECKEIINKKNREQFLTLDSLNTFLVSEPFTIQNGTTLEFSEGLGFFNNAVFDSVAAKKLIKNYHVNCKIEIIEVGTDKLIGKVKQVQFTSKDENNSDIKLSSLVIESKDEKNVRLRVTLTTNIPEVKGIFVNEYNTVNENILSKISTEKINLNEEGIISSYALNQNYPNPFNPTTTISYQVPEISKVTLKVYDILGKEIATLVNEVKEIGQYNVKFNGLNLASGVYIYRIEANNFRDTKKFILMK